MKIRRKYSLLLPACLIFIIGCGPSIQKPLPVCPGSGSVDRALDTLRQHSEKMLSFKAGGRCRLLYYDNGKKHNENLQVTVLVKSPFEIYLQAGMSVMQKAAVAGSSKDEFWLALYPKEISRYYLGQWSQLNPSQSILINPRTLLEAMGVAEVDLQADWSLSNEGVYDVLTKKENGIIAKKIYIYCCDNSIRKIEYFDADGRLYTVAKLDEYKTISGNFSIPCKINITTAVQSKKEDSVSLTLELGSVEARQITKEQDRYFQPAPMGGFKNIYKLINGKWIKQSP